MCGACIIYIKDTAALSLTTIGCKKNAENFQFVTKVPLKFATDIRLMRIWNVAKYAVRLFPVYACISHDIATLICRSL